jgi:hypothetical protein
VPPSFANNPYRALATDDFALLTNLLNGSSNFHFFLSNSVGGKILNRIRGVKSTRGRGPERAVSTYQKTGAEASIFGANRPAFTKNVKVERTAAQTKASHLKKWP